MKIFDCTIFLDEKMMYDLRLNILNDYVEKFVVVESLYTHAGNKKKQNFDINDYKKFKDKIIYILIDKEPEGLLNINDENESGNKRLNSLKRIQLQYNSLNKGIENANPDDLIILSDCDEIPNLGDLTKSFENEILIFKQRLYYFKFNYLYNNFKWYGSKGCKKKNLITFEWLRYIKNKKYNFWRLDTLFSKTKYRNVKFIEDGGWHFTNIKKPDELFYKFSNFGEHNEFEATGTTINDIKNWIDKGELFYDHSADKKSSANEKVSKKINLEINDKFLPKYLINNKAKYKDWFHE
tara:strand:- start:7093 stop:7977 length:885 start_codon:yes stop_codon:yes gene_type:complete